MEDGKLFYSIGDVAEMLNVSQSQIRFWEKEFEIVIKNKNKKGNRLFMKDDIEKFRTICHLLKEKKHTIEGAKAVLKAKRRGVKIQENGADAIDKLKSIKIALVEISDKIQSRHMQQTE